MCLVISNLPSYLPSLAVGLVPAGRHYYEGSDFCQPLQRISPTTGVSLSLRVRSLTRGAWNIVQATFLIAVVNDGFQRSDI